MRERVETCTESGSISLVFLVKVVPIIHKILLKLREAFLSVMLGLYRRAPRSSLLKTALKDLLEVFASIARNVSLALLLLINLNDIYGRVVDVVHELIVAELLVPEKHSKIPHLFMKLEKVSLTSQSLHSLLIEPQNLLRPRGTPVFLRLTAKNRKA